jgi:hypothetical protein
VKPNEAAKQGRLGKVSPSTVSLFIGVGLFGALAHWGHFDTLWLVGWSGAPIGGLVRARPRPAS